MATASKLHDAAQDEPVWEPLPLIRSERRMNVRALGYWQTRAGQRAMPMLADCADLDQQGFAGHMAVFDLSGPCRRPKVRHLGAMLAAGLDGGTVGRVGSPLSEFVRRLPAISTRRAPLDFDAEFPAHDDAETSLCLRGVLLPLADESGDMAHVLGVMNWRWSAGAAAANDVLAACAAMVPGPAEAAPAPLWQGGPVERPAVPDRTARMAAAQTWAALALADRMRADHHVHAALGAIHEATATLDDVAVRDAVREIFGAHAMEGDLDLHTRAILHARRIGLPDGRLPDLLARYGGARRLLASGEPPVGRKGGLAARASFTINEIDVCPQSERGTGMRVIG